MRAASTALLITTGATQRIALLCLACAADAQVKITCDLVAAMQAPRLRSLAPRLEGRRIGNVTLGPLMRKTGSTTITHLAGPQSARVKFARDYLQTHVVASVRDPIERFVSGYRQVETFYELGWVPGHFFRGQCVLKWTRDDCAGNPKMAAGFRSGKKEPPPPEAAARRKTRQIRRLLRFISDVEQCGFFDDHIYPMAPYFAALARAGVAVEAITLVKTDDLGLALPQHLRQPRVVPKAMSTAGRSWARILVAAAADPSNADSALAREAVRRICRLVVCCGAEVSSTQSSAPPPRHRGGAPNVRRPRRPSTTPASPSSPRNCAGPRLVKR